MAKEPKDSQEWIILVQPGTVLSIVLPDGRSVVRGDERKKEPLKGAIHEPDADIRSAAVRSGVFRYATPEEIAEAKGI